MIRYALRCENGHNFDSWFPSADKYDALCAAGHVTCPVCGTAAVSKAPMAPPVGSSTAPEARPAPPGPPDAAEGGAALAVRAAEAAARLRAHLEASTEDVGRRFAEEARAIHAGTAPGRAIRGEATLREARDLREDGIDALPLPFAPRRALN